MSASLGFPVNPRPFLGALVGRRIVVRLKWGMEYRGTFVSTDSYMNIQLSNTEEMLGGEFCGNLGEVLIRCNNVLYVQELPDSAQSAPTVTKTDVQEQQMTVE